MFNIIACPKYFFISWWNITPLNKYFIASILFAVGGILLVLGTKIFDFIAAIIIATGCAILLRAVISTFFPIHILGKFILILIC